MKADFPVKDVNKQVLSIITPCLNASKYLRNCIDSVLYACDSFAFEHIIIDGGSTDGSLDILKEYSHLRVISESDKGMYDALNKGMKIAQGSVIGHLNTDEQYNKEGLSLALSQMKDENVDAVFSPTVMLNSTYGFIQLFKQIVIPRVIDTHWCMPVQSCYLLFKKQLWQRCPYDARLKMAGDHAWFRRQMEMGMSLEVIKKPIGIFVWHSNNISNTLGKSDSEDVLMDINKNSIKLRVAKRFYRLRKLLKGGYRKDSVRYEFFNNGAIDKRFVRKPKLKVRQSVLQMA